MQEKANRKNWSRREFAKGLAAATAATATAGFSPLSANQKQMPRRTREGNIFDFHTHITQEWGAFLEFTAEDLLRVMDENGIEQAAVLPLVSPLSWDHPVTTDYVLEQTAPYRNRLIPFCAIDPRIPRWGRSLVDRLKQYIDAGARGFGEHKVGIPINDPRNIELFAACGEVGLPVLFHMDNLRNTDEPDLPGLERVLQKVPETDMVGHGPGWWASISGDVTAEDSQGYPDRPIAPSGANAITRDLEFGRKFLIRRADRLVFGTDVLKPGQDVPQRELYLHDKLDLPDEVQEKIFWENVHQLILDT